MKGVLRRAALVLAAGGIVATAGNAVSPVGLAWGATPRQSAAAEARELGAEPVEISAARTASRDRTVLLFDARPRARYEEGHLPGALSLPARSLDEALAKWSPILAPDQPIVVYCAGERCDDSLRVAELLVNQGYGNVKVFLGGYAEWKLRGLPVEKGSAP